MVLLLVIVFLALSSVTPALAGDSLPITLHVPHRLHFILALDEIELDWSRQRGAKTHAPGLAPVTAAGTWIVRTEPLRAVLSTSGITNSAGLLALATQLEGLNPGAETHLVLYRSEERAERGRQLLTREVGLILDAGVEAPAITHGLPVQSITAMPNLPGAYMIRAPDPLAAVILADLLRGRHGVRTAYPLLRYQLGTR